jgi:hypothetical protein
MACHPSSSSSSSYQQGWEDKLQPCSSCCLLLACQAVKAWAFSTKA